MSTAPTARAAERLLAARTTLVVAHRLTTAARADRIVVLDQGRILAEGSPADLIRDYSSREVVEVRFGSARNAEVAPQLSDLGDRIEVLPDRILIYAEDGEKILHDITALGLEPLTSLVRRSSLEDVFLRLTGRTLVD